MINKSFLCISTHTSPTRGFGGPSVSFRHFLNFLNSKDLSYTLITTSPYKFKFIQKDKILEFFFPTFFLHKVGFSSLSSLAIIFLSIFKRTIVINGITTIPNFSGLIGALLNPNAKVIIFSRGSFEINRTKKWFFLKKLYFRFNLFIVKYLDNNGRLLVVFQSESEKRKSLSIKNCMSKIIGNIDEFTFEEMINKSLIYAKKKKETDLIFIGRYSPEKGIKRLLRILKLLKKKKSNFKVVLIFDSLDREKILNLEKFLDDLNCEFFINLEHDIVLDKLSQSKLIFFPSYIENYGNVLVEAVIMGAIPVLYENTHWWNMYPKYSYNENDLINFINNKKINFNRSLSKKCISYIYSNYIDNNSFQSILDFIF